MTCLNMMKEEQDFNVTSKGFGIYSKGFTILLICLFSMNTIFIHLINPEIQSLQRTHYLNDVKTLVYPLLNL